MAVRRHGEVLIPNGGTTLQPGDVLTLIVAPASEAGLHAWLTARTRSAPEAPSADAADAAVDAVPAHRLVP